jgi:hypothetical protein
MFGAHKSSNKHTMSKDRQAVKEKKKEANPLSKKAPSDYQSGKKDAVKPIIESSKKKK